MRITTELDYAVRALVRLVGKERPISVTSIADAEGISRDMTEQLLLRMRRAGLVKSFRGVQGGYALTVEPEELTVLHVAEALGKKIQPPRSDPPHKVIGGYWDDLCDGFDHLMSEATLAHIAAACSVHREA